MGELLLSSPDFGLPETPRCAVWKRDAELDVTLVWSNRNLLMLLKLGRNNDFFLLLKYYSHSEDQGNDLNVMEEIWTHLYPWKTTLAQYRCYINSAHVVWKIRGVKAWHQGQSHSTVPCALAWHERCTQHLHLLMSGRHMNQTLLMSGRHMNHTLCKTMLLHAIPVCTQFTEI